ncbi:Ribose-5-phosphate isomerase B [Caprobacter fermentans]|uniref:Ribose-5-phosphate isomerase B n=1 Tax=Caproicibacter fermentans TaxID=2576756 RepID=A0A6N8I2S8_9FIRM|nr:ribose 5-phosphate isomerase B [Caproicibacter fermentans]MVB11843.1 Ribose-5-phosphate isomerase B [Caproicibacter fermentans]OCN00645.1 ribose 5-phosphate isomerase B [Clostridium sp. W14A]QNK41083.1 ribose 5-phosphate isomerase B [Caproicibacter fermentans]
MIALGADHGGYALKEAIKHYLDAEKTAYKDFGTFDENSVDYAPIAAQVAHFVADGGAELGILCCGTGIGMSMAANKVKGIRAAVCANAYCAEITRHHNNANILCLGGRVISEEQAVEFAKLFLNAPFDGGRHQRRVDEITKIEQGEL